MTDPIVDYVKGFWKVQGHGPSYREVAEGVGVSVDSAYKRVQKLISRGLLTKNNGFSRTLRVRRST